MYRKPSSVLFTDQMPDIPYEQDLDNHEYIGESHFPALLTEKVKDNTLKILEELITEDEVLAYIQANDVYPITKEGNNCLENLIKPKLINFFPANISTEDLHSELTKLQHLNTYLHTATIRQHKVTDEPIKAILILECNKE